MSCVFDQNVFIVTHGVVCTMYHDKYESYFPVRRGSMIGYNPKQDQKAFKNQQFELKWYRAIDSVWKEDEWYLILRDEKAQGNCQLTVPVRKCTFRFEENWTKHSGEWLPNLVYEKIGQIDGTMADGENAGVKILRLIKHLDENIDEIKTEKEYIEQYGIDNDELPRRHSRFDDQGFATEANRNNL